MNHFHNHHASGSYSRAFAVGVVLNVAFAGIEAGYGIFADSLVLIADAGHNLSDVVSLLLAWGGSVLATKAATEKRTYGFRKATILTSLASAIILLFVIGGIAWEAVGRFVKPEPVQGMTIVVVAAIGVVVNTLTALLFVKDQKKDLNIRGAFLHMAADAGVSFAVVLAGIVIVVQGWLWVDPVVSLIVVAVIFVGTWGLLRDSMDYATDAVPRSMDIAGIRQYLMSFDHVDRIHDLHVWPLSTTETALTVHLVVSGNLLNNDFLRKLQWHLHDHFGIAHSTIQIETVGDDNSCMLDSEKCI